MDLIDSIDPQVIGFSALIVFIAYLIRGVAGFGSALIAVPLLAINFPLQVVVPVVVALDYFGSAGQGLKNREKIQWAEIAPLMPFSVLGIVTALFMFQAVDPQMMTIALGSFVIFYAVYQIAPLPEFRGSRSAAAPIGFIGGLVGTMFGTGGPFYMIYLNMRGLDKTAMRATFATYFLVDATVRLAGYAVTGYFDYRVLMYFVAALPVAAVGLYFGGKIHVAIKQETYKRCISLVLVGSGIGLLLK